MKIWHVVLARKGHISQIYELDEVQQAKNAKHFEPVRISEGQLGEAFKACPNKYEDNRRSILSLSEHSNSIQTRRFSGEGSFNFLPPF